MTLQKNFISAEDHFYKKIVPKNNVYHLCTFKNIQNQINQSIQTAKQNYLHEIAKKLDDSNTSSKCC